MEKFRLDIYVQSGMEKTILVDFIVQAVKNLKDVGLLKLLKTFILHNHALFLSCSSIWDCHDLFMRDPAFFVCFLNLFQLNNIDTIKIS